MKRKRRNSNKMQFRSFLEKVARGEITERELLRLAIKQTGRDLRRMKRRLRKTK